MILLKLILLMMILLDVILLMLILLVMILLEVILLMLILLVILILLMVFREVHVQFALRSKFSYHLPSFPLPSKANFIKFHIQMPRI